MTVTSFQDLKLPGKPIPFPGRLPWPPTQGKGPGNEVARKTDFSVIFLF